MADNQKGISPLVSIVILNWNGLNDTKICLEHVRLLDYPNYEIIVVDNGSSQADKDYLSKLKDIIFIDNPKNRGFAGGQSDGYRASSGEFILLLNNDAVIKKDYLKNGLPLFHDPNVAVVGGRSYFWNDEELLLDETNRFYAYMNIDPVSAETTLMMKDYGVTQEVNVVSGSAVLVRRSVAEEIGYLWEPFFAYYEETDLFARIKRSGYKVLYSPVLQIWHKNGASSGAQTGSSFFFYHIFRNRYIFATRNFSDEYLSRFYKDYFKTFLQSTLSVVRSSDQRRFAISYFKAIVTTQFRYFSIRKDRKSLAKSLGESTYSKQIIAEQVTLSVVIDARDYTKHQFAKLVEKASKEVNPLVEYIAVTNSPVADLRYSKKYGLRLVIDKGYFESHSINLGCIAAISEWMIVSDTLPDTVKYIDYIAKSHLKNPQVVALANEGCSVAIRKDYYQRIGGFSYSRLSLKDCITYCKQYATVDNTITNDICSYFIPKVSKKDMKNEITYNNQQYSYVTESGLAKFLSKHYRLQQFTYLAKWLFLKKLPVRLKLARLKNLLVFSLAMNRKKLAVELKHIRNEYMTERRDISTSKLSKTHKDNVAVFTKEQLSSTDNIPVFIICFERVGDLKTLVNRLEKMGLNRIVFIDNNSTYPPLLNYLENSPHQTIRLYRNIGHTAPWALGIIRILLPYGYYIVTDPDVIPTNECVEAKTIDHLLELHRKYPAYLKIGLGLKTDDIPNHFPLKREVTDWESQFRKTRLESGVYEAGVDTTFALYKPGTFSYFIHPSIRSGAPYMARHMPWYGNPNNQTVEDKYYRMRANTDITSWNVDELPERYREVMKNDKIKN